MTWVFWSVSLVISRTDRCGLLDWEPVYLLIQCFHLLRPNTLPPVSTEPLASIFRVCNSASKVQVLLGNSSMIFCRPTDHHSFTYSLIGWLKVVVGFKFNNSDKYVSLIDVLPTQTMSVVPPPVISRSSVITVSRWLITNITITVSCRRPTADDDNSRSFLSSTRLCNECCLTYHVAQINCLQNRVTDIFTIS